VLIHHHQTGAEPTNQPTGKTKRAPFHSIYIQSDQLGKTNKTKRKDMQHPFHHTEREEKKTKKKHGWWCKLRGGGGKQKQNNATKEHHR